MARLIRMDTTGHSTLAEWTAGTRAEAACGSAELDAGYYAVYGGHPVPSCRSTPSS